jgi:hypothetical protein
MMECWGFGGAATIMRLAEFRVLETEDKRLSGMTWMKGYVRLKSEYEVT